MNHLRRRRVTQGTFGLLLAVAVPLGGVTASASPAIVQGANVQAASVKGSSVKGSSVKGSSVKGSSVKLTPRSATAAVVAQADGSQVKALVAAAMSQIGRTTSYDPAYVAIGYPGGDVPMDRGVCTDVLVRAFRGIGIDLQVAVHEDMVKRFSTYPKYGRSTPDPNIDHRRVKNLSTFFSHMGAAQPVTQNAADYLPGDIVMWSVGGLDHTGLVAEALVPGTDRRQVVHNIGDGAQLEDILFAYPVKGHFRYPVSGSAA